MSSFPCFVFGGCFAFSLLVGGGGGVAGWQHSPTFKMASNCFFHRNEVFTQELTAGLKKQLKRPIQKKSFQTSI